MLKPVCVPPEAKDISDFLAWMKLENTMLSEISQSEKDKYHTISFVYGI